MTEISTLLKKYAHQTSEIFAESLWPTSCVGCNYPELLLCDACRTQLPYIDWYGACKRCGSPYGRVQCCECNPLMMESLGVSALPFEICRSLVLFENTAAHLVKQYKDHGEQRLAPILAALMTPMLSYPGQGFPFASCILTFIPSSKRAFRSRGFDHMHLLANALGNNLGVPVRSLFERPDSADQRALNRKERYKNMKACFRVREPASIPSRIILIDDVYTTGATLISASEALISCGAQSVYSFTFARVP